MVSSVPRRLFAVFGRRVFGNPLYPLTLGRRVPESLRLIPPDPWSGDPDAGKAILDGEFPLGGGWLAAGEVPWGCHSDSARKKTAPLHGFAWLADLRALGSNAARDRARTLVAGWSEHHRQWDALIWRPDVLGQRITAWLSGADFLLSGADETFRKSFFASLSAQARHLGRTTGMTERTASAFPAIKGLIYAGLALPDAGDLLAAGRRLLDEHLTHQILPDGGHFQRNPSLHLGVLRTLSDIRTVLLAAQTEVPASLLSAIDCMTPMLRAFRHGDGALALFNGSFEEDRRVVDAALSQAGVRGQAPTNAPHSGYQRLTAGRTVMLIDVGAPPPNGADADAHAGALSFEMSVGRHRLIVNCGADAGDETAWQKALRGTAAHSTLCLEDTNSTEIAADGHMGPRVAQVTAARGETDHAIWVEASHDGYGVPFGVRHHRRLMLDLSGTGLSGEDRITGGDAGSRPPFAIRFHLHPQVQASAQAGGSGVLLRLPGGIGWRFTAQGGGVSLEESLYSGVPDVKRRCDQIVVAGRLGSSETVIRWMLSEIPKD